ncbi:xanthine dehydrogenase accessory factor [Blastomonas natatoria]|uniref:Xanthine dehydrogenase accessory factor n=1 Tax=Blastomonas natatoria TaxID=34015 RepID=A0A2V3V7E2_9SPHN|nr:XdhC family protein [Blastomonas natatoria]PXW77742.1 xanthine dehydrogenase accessory factor [Blastomonas natatoria]
MSRWPFDAQTDDIRPLLMAAQGDRLDLAIATLVETSGPAPRSIGAQMLVTRDQHWGYLSGGCIEADVARHAREAMADGAPRLLRYGEGSPWIDIRLACGSGILVLVEPVSVDEPAITALIEGMQGRYPIRWSSDGKTREARACNAKGEFAWDGTRYAQWHEPILRLVLIGEDATTLACAALGQTMGMDVVMITPNGPQAAPMPGIAYHRSAAAAVLDALDLDRWSAVAVLSHDREDDEAALAAALRSPAFYIGAIGARVRLDGRIAQLRAHGVGEADIARLRAPIGLQGFGKAPREVALSVVAEVARDFHARSAAANPSGSSISSTAPPSWMSR